MDLFVAILQTISALALPFIAYWIRKLEKNTNSIKDALVTETQKSYLAKGKLEGRAELTAETTEGK